ncbi:ABC transporter ATP-binding protein [Hypnocyclicus thermotrophus]|uniref:ABC transporter ATP-binding protein n=1 Tax=Hypnocyclicus thermotrophus TaxID=1627895 RepID=UPI0010656E0D
MFKLLLEVHEVTKQFGGLTAVDTINLNIKKDELIGLIGPNGAGKTTFFNLLTGVYEPTSGYIKLLGEDITGQKPYRITEKGMARTFQNIRLFKDLSVLDNVRVAKIFNTDYGIFDSIFRTKKFYKEEIRVRKEAEELLDRFGLLKKMDLPAHSLPYGEQRKLEIVRALATNPKLLLLDEPAAGMNPQETTELMDLIKKVKNDFDISILLIEHDMKFVMSLCERIAVLDYGKIIALDTPEKIKNNKKVIEAYLGEVEED